MNLSTTCKFCKFPITVEIDDEYARMGDPFKILPLAACNRCADLREHRRSLDARLKAQCFAIQLLNSAKTPVPEKARMNLEFLVREYLKMVSTWNKIEDLILDRAIIDALCTRPQNWGDIIGRLWRMRA